MGLSGKIPVKVTISWTPAGESLGDGPAPQTITMRQLIFVFAAALILSPQIWAGDPSPEALNDMVPEIRNQIKRLQRSAPLDGGSYRDHYQLANLYYEAGFFEASAERYDRALEMNPEFYKAMVNYGSLLEDIGDDAGAIEKYESALKINPEDCNARSNLGAVYYRQKRFPDAIYEYRRAIDLDSSCYASYFNLASAFADFGIYRDSIKYFEEVIRVAPGTAAAREAQGNIDLMSPMTEGPIPVAPVGKKQ
jgi:tetratricopeptide (TPR) repeat protein